MAVTMPAIIDVNPNTLTVISGRGKNFSDAIAMAIINIMYGFMIPRIS
jgi:hypothetical protein